MPMPPRTFEPLSPPTPPSQSVPQTVSAPDGAAPAVQGDSPPSVAGATPDSGTDAGASVPLDPVLGASPIAAAAPHTLRPVVEKQLEARMRTFDPNNAGLTREQMAKAFPRAAERFEEVDANHDGRVNVNELIAAWSRIATFPQQ